MEVLPSIDKLNITRSDIYEEYTKNFTKREVSKLDFQPKIKQELEIKYFTKENKNYQTFYKELAQYYARLLHLEGKVALNQKSLLF